MIENEAKAAIEIAKIISSERYPCSGLPTLRAIIRANALIKGDPESALALLREHDIDLSRNSKD